MQCHQLENAPLEHFEGGHMQMSVVNNRARRRLDTRDREQFEGPGSVRRCQVDVSSRVPIVLKKNSEAQIKYLARRGEVQKSIS